MKWHELDPDVQDRLLAPATREACDQLLAAVYGDDFTPVVENRDLWRSKALREGLGSWWPFDCFTPDGAPVTLSVMMWDLSLIVPYDQCVLAGEDAISALEGRLRALRRQWGVVLNEDDTEALVALKPALSPRSRPSALAG
jgi:hypothetical protein